MPLVKKEEYPPEEVLELDGLYRYLLQPGEEHADQRRRATDRIWSKQTFIIDHVIEEPKNRTLYYLTDGPERAFVREELMWIPFDTQLPPERVQQWYSINKKFILRKKYKKMSLVFLSSFETLFDEQNKPWYKLDDIKRYLISAGIQMDNIRVTKKRSELKDRRLLSRHRSYNPHDVFLSQDSTIVMCLPELP